MYFNFLAWGMGSAMASYLPKPSCLRVPTPPRSKSTATCRKPAPERVSILDKLQQIRSSSTSLSTSRPVAAAAMAVADGDSKSSSDSDGCSAEDEQGRSSTRKNVP